MTHHQSCTSMRGIQCIADQRVPQSVRGRCRVDHPFAVAACSKALTTTSLACPHVLAPVGGEQRVQSTLQPGQINVRGCTSTGENTEGVTVGCWTGTARTTRQSGGENNYVSVTATCCGSVVDKPCKPCRNCRQPAQHLPPPSAPTA